MPRIMTVTDCYGPHKYGILKETPDIIELTDVTFMDEYPLRFNKREGRVECFNGTFWDVYISDTSIVQIDFEGETDEAPPPKAKPAAGKKKSRGMSKYKPTRSSRLCPLCRSHAKRHGVETPYSEWCSSNGKCVICGSPHTHEKHWHSRAFFRDYPIPESYMYVPRRRKADDMD